MLKGALYGQQMLGKFSWPHSSVPHATSAFVEREANGTLELLSLQLTMTHRSSNFPSSTPVWSLPSGLSQVVDILSQEATCTQHFLFCPKASSAL